MKTKILLILALMAGIVIAEDVILTARSDAQAGTVRDIAVNDSASAADWLPLAESTGDKLKICVQIKFTQSGANTANVTIVRGNKKNNRLVPQSSTKAVATSNNRYTDDEGYYLSNDIVFDTNGYPYYVILVDTISSGNAVIVRSRS